MLLKAFTLLAFFAAFNPFIKADPAPIQQTSPLMIDFGHRGPDEVINRHHGEERPHDDRDNDNHSAQEERTTLGAHGPNQEGANHVVVDEENQHANQPANNGFNFAQLVKASALTALGISYAGHFIPASAWPSISHYALSPTCRLVPEAGVAATWLRCRSFPNATFVQTTDELQRVETEKKVNPLFISSVTNFIFRRQNDPCSTRKDQLQAAYKLNEEWEKLAETSWHQLHILSDPEDFYARAAWQWEFERAQSQQNLMERYALIHQKSDLLCDGLENYSQAARAKYPDNIALFEEAILKNKAAQELFSEIIKKHRDANYGEQRIYLLLEEQGEVTFRILQFHSKIAQALIKEAFSNAQFSQNLNDGSYEKGIEFFDKAMAQLVKTVDLGDEYAAAFPESSFLQQNWPPFRTLLQETESHLNETVSSFQKKLSQKNTITRIDYTF